jgi:hypothetical protein
MPTNLFESKLDSGVTWAESNRPMILIFQYTVKVNFDLSIKLDRL